MARRKAKLHFTKGLGEYRAENGLIDEFGLEVLQEKLGGSGFIFDNDYDENVATMSYSMDVDRRKLTEAMQAFENFVNPA